MTALSRHLAQVRTAVAAWAARDASRAPVAASVFELLLPAEQDTSGSATLDSVASILEAYEGVFPLEVVRQLQALVTAAHALGRKKRYTKRDLAIEAGTHEPTNRRNAELERAYQQHKEGTP